MISLKQYALGAGLPCDWQFSAKTRDKGLMGEIKPLGGYLKMWVKRHLKQQKHVSLWNDIWKIQNLERIYCLHTEKEQYNQQAANNK